MKELEEAVPSLKTKKVLVLDDIPVEVQKPMFLHRSVVLLSGFNVCVVFFALDPKRMSYREERSMASVPSNVRCWKRPRFHYMGTIKKFFLRGRLPLVDTAGLPERSLPAL